MNQSRIYPDVIATRPAPIKARPDRRARVTVLAALALGAAMGGPAWAQVPNPAPTNEQPSQRNPVPRAGGDAQNSNRAQDDKLWGVGGGNVRGFENPFSRIPNISAVSQGNGRLVPDGWQFPRLASNDPARLPLAFGAEVAVGTASIPANGLPVGPGVEFFAAPWVNASTDTPAGTSINFLGTDYQRTPAVSRLVGSPLDTITPSGTAPNNYPNNTVKWYPNVGGAAGLLRRFAVSVYLPTPEAFAEDGTLPVEGRIEDARYTIYYQVRKSGGGFTTNRRIVYLSQSGSGWVTFVDSSRQPLYFPMATEASGLGGNARPRVELDNTTEGPTSQAYVIANQIRFTPASDFGEIKAPTTVTSPGGGRKIDYNGLYSTFALGDPYDPTKPLFQPVWTARPANNPYAAGGALTAFLNDSFEFINNPRQINYPANPELPTVDNNYTNTASAFYQPYEPWNPSILFQGPASLVDDQTDPTNPVNASGVQPSLRTNQNRYEYTDASSNVFPIPLFSHMQSLVPRTEYVTDPKSADGLGTLSVGCVYSVDWTTGAPIWRFPDRTYLPVGFKDQYDNPVAGAGLRNPDTTDAGGNVIPTVPGIGAYDRNGDGYISDDEVYIVGQGGNNNGGIEAGITIVPRIYTRATEVGTKAPAYDDTWNPYTSPTAGINSSNVNVSPIRGVVNVPAGRYSQPDAPQNAVEASIALVASDNGVLYAIDPHGNNDNRYYAPTAAISAADPTAIGTYHAGSTNAMWTFSVLTPSKTAADTVQTYNQKLKDSIPATGAWAHSTPVIAYAKEDTDLSLNRFTDEPRLFIGNSNGVLYALNAVADPGEVIIPPSTVATPTSFPYRKKLDAVGGTPDVRWWFETEAAITTAPAVSPSIHPQYQGNNTPKAKGVYVTSNDGRVYSLDWDGPVTGPDKITSLIFSGSNAGLLNDNFRFHNANSTAPFARADGTEGTVRPRWVFPSRYRDLNGDGNNSELDGKPADSSNVYPDYPVERQTRLAPINSAPSLMDYPWLNPVTGLWEIKKYVAIAANDLNGSKSPTSGRVYLLDQVGDRRDTSVKPVKKDVADGTKVAFGQPDDMYAPTEYTFSDATPAWTYRPVYKRYNDTTGTSENVQARNRPGQQFTPVGGVADDPTNINTVGLPEKRILPTLFAGGLSGRLFALDIDPQTGLFFRWRGNVTETKPFVPLPDTYTDADNTPNNEPVSRRLDPPNATLEAVSVVGGATLTARPPFVRIVKALGAQDIVSITVSGGPQQNRNHPYATAAPVNGPTVPALPTNNAPSLLNPGVPYTAAGGTVPTTNVQPFYWDKNNVDAFMAGTPLDFTKYPLLAVPALDITGRFTNQDHDDPAATTRGTYADPDPAVVGNSLAAINPELNRAYQYPVLAVTSSDGLFSLISTELDGLDSLTQTPGTDSEYLMGWAVTTDPLRANPMRPFLLSMRGPGGPGTQVAMITDAYYGAMDPGFRNSVQKLATGFGASPADPSLNFQTYPWYEPRNVGVLGTGTFTSPFDTPRPRFEPRSLYSGNTANNVGPDGDPLTPDGWPEIKADAHTGRTGLPLDLRGLFYDKKFADNRPQAARAEGNTNDNGLIRLPGYTGIGEALPLLNRRVRSTQSQPFVTPGDAAAVANTALGFYTPLADGTPDTPRDTSTGATSPYRTDPFKLFPGALDPADPYIRPEADMNPAGTNAAWIFVGGSDGVFYAYTPNRFSVPLYGGGVGSGFVGGGGEGNSEDNPGEQGTPRLMLVSETTFNSIQTTPRRPVATDDLRASGKPYYEYGERVFAVVYDIARVPNNPRRDISVSFQPAANITTRSAGTTGVPNVIANARILQTFSYPYDPTTQLNRPADPSQRNANSYPRQIALLRVQVNTNYNQGGADGRRGYGRNGAVSAGWTPGTIYEAGITGYDTTGGINAFNLPGGVLINSPGVGGSEAEVLANAKPLIAIANPLAVQAFLLSSDSKAPALATIADPDGNGRVYNGIGPFASGADSGTAGAVKTRVAQPAALAGGGDVTKLDPDRAGYEYSQALTNGNRILRFDLDLINPANLKRNLNYGGQLNSGTGTNATKEPGFYMPVAASAGNIDHGSSGSTVTAGQRRTLRLVNRSLQRNLAKLRVEIRSDALFRSWPGIRPNVRPNDGALNANGVPTVASSGNVRLTPNLGAGGAYLMRPDGIINYLPWEQPMVATLPWERDSAAVGLVGSLSNNSADYPDIPALTDSAANKQTIQVITESGDLVRSSGNLKASVGIGSTRINSTVQDPSIQDWTYVGNSGNFAASSVEVRVQVPYFQPANLVSMHSLTSTYEAPSTDEAPADFTSPGGVQLPRTTATSALNRAAFDRGLRTPDPNASAARTTDLLTVTPMGYTVQMRAYLDINGDGRFDETEPYRDFETWFGVPVDISLSQKETSVDMPGPSGSAYAHGMGTQDGYLGYGTPASVGTSIGFLPSPLTDSTVAGLTDPYSRFFTPITLQSKSNVNLWNIRASQKIEQYKANPSVANAAGNGAPYQYFAMQSLDVNPYFGILAVEADPKATNAKGVMPNVVTSLDKKFDTAWDAQFQVNSAAPFYATYYKSFGGRHPLHKPAAGTPRDSVTVLGIPDVPATSLSTTVANPNSPPLQLGIAVPLGTPSGIYSNNISGTPFAFFEDHDTPSDNAGYPVYNSAVRSAARTANSITLSPAGPLYGGQDILHPGTLARNAGGAGLLQNNVLIPSSGEGVLRPRALIGGTPSAPFYEYLPSTTVTTKAGRVAFGIRATVVESALTGQIADQALTSGSFFASVVSGVLPGIDNAPMFDTTSPKTGNVVRPESSLAPAAYRTAAGNLVLYYDTNEVGSLPLLGPGGGVTGAPRSVDAHPGAPFNLFGTSLTWNAVEGTWQAASIGTPIDGTNLFNTNANTGAWFAPPTQINQINTPDESNLSPFILHDPLLIQNGLATAEATLFVMNVVPTATGDAQYSPYFASLGTDGTLGTFTSLLPRTGDGRLDATLRRLSPRAVFAPTAGTVFTIYYGGTTGKNSLLYVAAPANASNNGGIDAAALATAQAAGTVGERLLKLPGAVTSASDPMPVTRAARITQNAQGLWVYDPTAQPQLVVDVYYTGVVRGGNSADLLASRYRVDGSGANARLVPVDLPKQYTELLVGQGRTSVFRGKHVGWYNRLDAAAPRIDIVDKVSGTTTAAPAGWQLDNATKLLFQTITLNGKPVIVYVDTSAGVVTFRGANAPTVASQGVTVLATYTPLAYRVAASDAAETGGFGFMDRRVVDTTAGNNNGNVLGAIAYGVQTRYGTWDSTLGQGIDRQWLYWQRSSLGGVEAKLFYKSRRVGLDMKALNVLKEGESIKLSTTTSGTDPYGNPILVIPQTVQIAVKVNGTDVPYEVDYSSGRIYTQASLEGLIVTITGTKTTHTNPVVESPIDFSTVLTPISESGGEDGIATPVSNAVNEGQPYVFLDLYDGRASAAGRTTPGVSTDAYPEAANDPALQPGRMWMFWSSPRGRTGLARITDPTYQSYFGGAPIGQAITVSGYDLYWQTLAPNLDSKPLSFTGYTSQ